VRKTLSDKGVAVLKPRSTAFAYPDPELRGHYVRIHASGSKVFVAVARDPNGKQIWHTIGNADVLKIDEARDQAREAIKRIKAGLPPLEAPPVTPDSFRSVAENWLKRHVEKNKLRTQPEIERCLLVYVYPHWADRPFTGIRRADFTALLDRIEDERGSRMADIVFGVVRSIGNWMAGRDDTYLSPFNVRGQRRSSGAKRSRILDDSELRKVWKEAEGSGSFGALIKTLLLTGQRRGAVLGMRWDDISADGVWTIASEAREKINAGSLKLPAQVLQIINAQPKYVSSPYVFAASRGNGPMNGFSRAKVSFDKRCGVEGWTLHDLRRCARSLMSRAGVSSEHAERVLGHVVAGIEGRYDVHKYDDEKTLALSKLATLIDGIVDPRDDNVLPMKKKRSR
jgi:integrase